LPFARLCERLLDPSANKICQSSNSGKYYWHLESKVWDFLVREPR
jgi:hypothetical protein